MLFRSVMEKNLYPQKNLLWCYSFITKELFSLPADDVPQKPAFLFDVYSSERLLDMSKTHAVTAISFWSCEDKETLQKYLDGLLPQYFMVYHYKRWVRCTVVAEGNENIYVVKYAYPPYPDIMVRCCRDGRLVRTFKDKVKPYDPSVCKQ